MDFFAFAECLGNIFILCNFNIIAILFVIVTTEIMLFYFINVVL